MPRFSYHVRDRLGRTDTGVLTAENLSDASQVLRKQGKVIIHLNEEVAPQRPLSNRRGGRVKRDDVTYFATQLAVMVDTGVPLPEALDAICEQTDHQALKDMLSNICEGVKGGTEFSTTLEDYPKVFSKLFVAMMRASEASGRMGQMLQDASKYLARDRETRKQVKGAMTYPVCILAFCSLVMVGLMAFVMPRFEKIYSGKGAILPLPTRLLLGISSGLVNYWPFILLGLMAACVGLYLYVRTPDGKTLVHRLQISTPILGSMYRKACMARSLRTLATMVSSGVSMLDGLAITAQVAGNHFYSRIWLEVSQRVQEGSTIAEPLFEQSLIPATVSQMIRAGERAGKLGDVLHRIADFCEEDLKISVKTVTSMIEPLMIIIMGLIVGSVAMALLLPVFNISRIVAK